MTAGIDIATAGLPLGRARVVLGDPSWWFSTYSRKGWQKSAHSHYPCLSLDDIKALPVASLCAPDCALVLWSTQTHIPMALVLEEWGFAFKTIGAWAKLSKSGAKWQFGTVCVRRPSFFSERAETRARQRRICAT
jgi:N6-adenosine-specific RNA methylase IME4